MRIRSYFNYCECTGSSTCSTDCFCNGAAYLRYSDRNDCCLCTLGAGLEYSIDGTAYQASPTFNLVAPGTYNVTVRNATGCVSGATSITVNAPAAAPAAPTASVTVQPTCAVPTGTIVVSAPLGAGLEYSIDGTAYQASPTFNLVAPGTYDVTVRNAAGCVSAATSITVNAPAAAPAAPTASVTVQPTCASPTGTIVVTAPLGAGLELQHRWNCIPGFTDI